jgi:hypothetical protein
MLPRLIGAIAGVGADAHRPHHRLPPAPRRSVWCPPSSTTRILLDTAMTIAGEIRANSPWGVAQTKEVMWSQLEDPVPCHGRAIDLDEPHPAPTASGATLADMQEAQDRSSSSQADARSFHLPLTPRG